MKTYTWIIAAGLLAGYAPLGASAGEIIEGDTAALDLQSWDAVQAGASQGTLKIGWFGSISPQWLAPLTGGQAISTTNSHKYFIHDAMLKGSGKGLLTLSLAEAAEASPDFTTFGFRLRDDIAFHDGTPVTAEDVKFTFETYSGVNAALFGELIESVETPDDRTVIVQLSRSEPDFLYFISGASTAGNIGWVVPKAYYEEVGEQGYLANPIGAGPFVFESAEPGTSLTLTAFADYWRRPPGVERIEITSISSPATGLAALKTGEIDFFTNASPVKDQIMKEPDIRWDRNLTGSWLLFFPNYTDPDSPFHDKRVREAASLALNRPFLNVQGTSGLGEPWGSWVIPENPGFVEMPVPAFDVERARTLMTEAGYPDGIDIDGLIPFFVEPKAGERFLANLAAVGIRGTLQTLEAPQYFATTGRGSRGIESLSTIVMAADQIGGPASMMVAKYGLCDAPTSFICDSEVDAMWAAYQASLDPAERDRISGDIQRRVIEEFYVLPTYRNSFTHAIGPRVMPQGPSEDGAGFHTLWNSPLTPFPHPWEDWQVATE